MPKVMKPPTDYDDTDIDTGGDWYDGPPPPPALYKGVVKKMLLTKVEAGEKKGEQRIMVVCEISEGKYKGAGVSKWLQLTKQGSPWLNQFLHAISDGTDEGKKRVRQAFKAGYTVDDIDAKKRYPIIKIGKVKTEGLSCSFVTKMRTSEGDGVTRAEIARFVTPFNPGADDDEDTSPEDALDADDDDSYDDSSDASGDDEFTTDDDSTDDSGDDDTGEDASQGGSSEAEPATAGDADDPWSV